MTGIVFLDRDTFASSVRISRPAFEHNWTEYAQTSLEQIESCISDAEIVVTNKVPMRREVLDKLSGLKMIAVAATGYDVIDIAACRERNIVVSNVRGYATDTVPEHVFALILALRRSVIGYRDDILHGKWQNATQFCLHTHTIHGLHGSTLGIIGRGVLGRAVGKIAKAFGMRVLFAERKGAATVRPDYTPFDTVLAQSDIISLHCPLTSETRNLLDTEAFRKMKRRPLIVNTARGGVASEQDLVAALDEGLISGIGVDCLTTEPPAKDNPLLGLGDRPDVIVTPHVAWASREAMQACWDQVVEHIENFHAGHPSNEVT